MSITANDKPVLVAPRPVRFHGAQHTVFTRSLPVRLVSTPAEHRERAKIAEDGGLEELKIGLFPDPSPTSDKDSASPRASPRSGLPTEALEEFLSILRPSFFPPSSPVLRTCRQGAHPLPTFQHERSYPYKARGRFELAQRKSEPNNLYDLEELDGTRSSQPSRNNRSSTPDSVHDRDAGADLDVFDSEGLPIRWFMTKTLSSPISRMHTRNPFQRHPSYPSSHSPPPIAPLSPISPAAVPLPLPTPDEMIEIS